MQTFKCPHCDEIIKNVKYRCYTSGSEWGDADINNNGKFVDHECNDSSNSDTSDYEYTCPHCDRSINEDDIIDQAKKTENNENEPKNEDGKIIKEPKKKPKLEKLLSKIPNNIKNLNEEKKEYFQCKRCKEINFMEEDEECCMCTKCNSIIIKPRQRKNESTENWLRRFNNN